MGYLYIPGQSVFGRIQSLPFIIDKALLTDVLQVGVDADTVKTQCFAAFAAFLPEAVVFGL